MSFLSGEIVKGTNWRAVERAVARLMTHCGWNNVRIVGGRGDGGGDIIATRWGNGRQIVYVVQVKAVTGHNYVGHSAMQEVLNAMALYGADIGVVATNGDFTDSAHTRGAKLKSQGFDIRLWNGKFIQELLASWPSEMSPQYKELRPYQLDVVTNTLTRYQAGVNHTQFVVATGLGKTVIAADIVSKLAMQGLHRTLVLCHAQELALQLEQSFWTQLGRSVPTSIFFDGSLPKVGEGVSFGLYQTFSNYLNSIVSDAYDLVIVDEAHHALAQGFVRCLNYLKPKLMVGMTATPWRGDGLTLDTIFGPPVAQVSLVDGMQMGYLAQADYRIYYDTIDWDKIARESHDKISISELNKRLFVPQRDEAVIEKINEACQETPKSKIIIFCASIEHARRFAAQLTALSRLICKPLSGVDKVERNRTLMEFAAGKIQAVTAVDILNEGIDVPDVNILVFLRTTHSRRIFVQQLGRGLRISPGKDKVLVMDFVADVRRLAGIIKLDKEARHSRTAYQEVYFNQGIITFMNQGMLPFVQQWLKDVADFDDADDAAYLTFPEEL